MIITFTLSKVIRLVIMSSQLPPSINICELEIDKIKMGIITGNPRMAIITALLLVLLAMDETMVNEQAKPKEPIIKLMMKGTGFLTGKPRNNEKTMMAKEINSHWYKL